MGSRRMPPPTAPAGLMAQVEELLKIATKAKSPPLLRQMSQDKLFEVLVLAKLLRLFTKHGGTVSHVAPTSLSAPITPPAVGKGLAGGTVVVAGSPASANRRKFSHFAMVNVHGQKFEAWVSLEMQTLSASLSHALGRKLPSAALHEWDVGMFKPFAGIYPTYNELAVGVSCKNVSNPTKAIVREALGLRRESAYLRPNSMASRAPWLVPIVPAAPASVVLLACSNPGIRTYRNPVDGLGVYVRYINFKP